MFVSCLAAVSLAQTAPTDPAQPPEEEEDGPAVKVGGVVYPRYGFDLTDGADGFNSFDVDRSYIRVDAKLHEKVAGRVTVDANRMSAAEVELADGTVVEVPADSRLRLFLKHAWLEYKPVSDVQIRFGMVDTPYLPWEESFEGMRYLFRVFLDDVKLESTTDLGISASGRHAEGVVGWGLGIFNGEFFSSPEVDAGKSFQARLSFDPLATRKGLGLPIGVFVDEELHADADPETVVGGLAGFRNAWLVATAEIRDGRAWIGGVPTPAVELPEGRARVVVRAYDLKLWHVTDGGVATVERVLPLGDRVRVEALLDDGAPIFAQFPRRSSLLNGVVPGSRVAVEITHARAWSA